MAEAGLLEWADKQSDWVRDALRRQALQPGFILDHVEKVAVADRVRYANGFASDEPPTCSPLTPEDLKTGKSNEPRAVLCSLGPVKNLNRLAAKQQLRFATDGITIIYGDNGSGKSGYCRITKKLCRSLTADDLLGNVFEAGAKPPAEVVVRFLEDGAEKPTEVVWTDGTPSPSSIAQISVFDSANARLYVDKQNRIGFLPTAVALLEQHGILRGELETKFRDEIKAIEKKLKTPLPAGYSAAGDVTKMLARLDVKSKQVLPSADEIKNLASVSDQELAELSSLEQSLATDPSTIAAKRRRAKSVLAKFLKASEQIDEVLSTKAVDAHQDILRTAEATAEAAKLAASDAFAAMPLSGVGLSPWRLMFDHARSYAASIDGVDHHHLPDKEGDLCLLCQEPMTAATAARVVAFNEFVTGETDKAARAASAAKDDSLRRIKELHIETEGEIETILGEFGDLSVERKELVLSLKSYFRHAKQRQNAIVALLSPTGASALPPLGTPVATKLLAEIDALEAEALEDDKAAAGDVNRAADRIRRDVLKDRKKLLDDVAVVLSRLADLEEHRKLLACCDVVETGSVSRLMTSLRRSLVMKNLEKRIVAEIEALSLTHIPFAVSDRSQDGQSYFEIELNAAKGTAKNKVLSEGEQRALALACFLAEVGGDTSRQGMIIDDPVSSLDHVRIRRVAARLVSEAATGRQVIIFTHNLLFFNEVVDAAAQSNPPIPLVRNYISKSEAAGFGLISETDEPWISQGVTKRIETLRARLKSFDGVADFTTDSWRRSAKDFYTDLRETWERFVEEILLGKVVERFNSDVRTQSLKAVVVEDEDHKEVYWAMKRVSERSGHDMAAGKAIPVPTPSDMKNDLDVIEQYRITASKRKKDVEKRRAQIEQPPKAKVM